MSEYDDGNRDEELEKSAGEGVDQFDVGFGRPVFSAIKNRVKTQEMTAGKLVLTQRAVNKLREGEQRATHPNGAQ